MRHALPARVRRWARRARNLKETGLEEAIRSQLSGVMQRLSLYQIPTPVLGHPVSRSALTRLYRELQDATETSTHVAEDVFLQQFRKRLHLLLDH